MTASTTTGLVTWLREQIAERATWARAAEQAATDSDGYQWKRMASATIDAGDCLIQTDHADIGRFVEDNSPRTVLAQCEAHQLIVDGYAALWANTDRHTNATLHLQCSLLEQVARALALAYQYRPGYREEWKP